jgi:hypothetical protein
MKALIAIQAEWTSGATYQQRINHLTGATPGGLNGANTLVPGTTVFDDTSVDTLTGGGGQDWFLANRSGGGTLDTITDLAAGEVVTDL